MTTQMAEWTRATVGDCLAPLPLGTARKLKTKEYRISGSYPIVDQGQALIAGWTDDDSGLISTELPIVVFGDHTRTLKFIDFPFVRGADGTQILKPIPGIDPLFFYYACRAIDLPNRGYNRHFRSLKEMEIPLPSLDEQRDISLALKLVNKTHSLQDAQFQTSDVVKRAAMHALFTSGLRSESQKETEIGPMPNSWKVESLGAHHSVLSGGTPSRSNSAYWCGGTIPWVKTTEVGYRVIQDTEEHISQAGLDQSAAKLLPAGTLLLAMYGQGVTRGKVAILGIEATCNQACAAIRPLDDAVTTKFLYHYLSYRYDDIRLLAHGGQQQNLNLDIVRFLPIAFSPDRNEQIEIVTILDAIDRKIDLHRRKRAVLDDLFKALLQKLMTGEYRATDLDLSALAPKPITEVTA